MLLNDRRAVLERVRAAIDAELGQSFVEQLVDMQIAARDADHVDELRRNFVDALARDMAADDWGLALGAREPTLRALVDALDG